MRVENILKHEGKPRRSGRYPWGSGENPDPASPRGQVLKKESDSTSDAKIILRDKSQFDSMSTKDLQDLVLRVGLENQLRTALEKNAEANRSFTQKAMRKLGGMAVKTVTDFAMTQAQKKINSYLNEKMKGFEELKKANETAKKVAAETVSEAVKEAKKSGFKTVGEAFKEAFRRDNKQTVGEAFKEAFRRDNKQTVGEAFRRDSTKPTGDTLRNLYGTWQKAQKESYENRTPSSDIIDLVQNSDNLWSMGMSTALAIYNPKR